MKSIDLNRNRYLIVAPIVLLVAIFWVACGPSATPSSASTDVPVSTSASLTPASPEPLAGKPAGEPPKTEIPVDSGVKMNSDGSQWDVVVLGWIDACWVCQFGPPPHVRYTQVLDGQVPNGQAEGRVALIAIADHLLPKGGVPIYKSQQEEICFLKKVVVPGYEDADVYEVVDVKEATPENLASFHGL